MSDRSLGTGWWYASDGKWYPPETHPDYRPPAPPQRQANPTGLGGMIALALLCVLMVGGVTIFLVATEDGTDEDVTFEEDAFEDDGFEETEDEIGADADLDELHSACEDGDMEACDDLYFESPVGSDEEEFGSTCGGRRDEQNGDCA